MTFLKFFLALFHWMKEKEMLLRHLLNTSYIAKRMRFFSKVFFPGKMLEKPKDPLFICPNLF